MTYFAGDIHGNPNKICQLCEKNKLTEEDVVIILGDVGANYYGDKRDKYVKKVLNNLNPTILCIHGNHEQRPSNFKEYTLTEWNGGMVWVEPE